MVFIPQNATIQLGDIVVVYVNPEDMKAIKVTADSQYQNRYGTFFHNDMVGKLWGSKLATRGNKGFIYLLVPTPELWTLVLPHRTQILYQPDISLITSFLEMKPGVRMIEAGTGSGSFSHSAARTIAPNGILHSFEFHAERAEKARVEFESHGLSDIIKSSHRDVCKDGFGIVGEVTAVFLDLPSPWEALEHAKLTCDPRRVFRICCFSPCMEQVQRTCLELHRLKFQEIRMFECLVRPYDMRQAEVEALPLDKPTPKGSGKIKKRYLTTDEDASERYILSSKPKASVRGHTSFLTFAILLPEEDTVAPAVPDLANTEDQATELPLKE
ncbi:hypothetical protein BASA61_003543 [Batrachochytrium salamandrivorans]|nr:hypothetical protein BASA61_003543 [Batrachochytrium salamandrivorans]KAH9267444.1 hypothetical protein BASA83_009983 [Batrachochytrium salamandrivorans]